MVTRVVLLFVLASVPAVASGQTPAVAVGKWDIAATGGLFSGYRPRTEGSAGYQQLWFHNVQGGVTLGRYLTRHLKLEFEASATNGGTQLRERSVNVPGYPYPFPVASEVTTSVRSLAAAVTWQFRENEWVHPFVQAGVAADFDRVSIRTWEQFFHGGGPAGAPPQRVVEERFEGPDTTRELRGVLGGGAKVYVSPNVFIRPDGRWTFTRERQNVALRLGVGIDF